MSQLYNDRFTGDDDDAWDVGWSDLNGTFTRTIQGNRGEVTALNGTATIGRPNLTVQSDQAVQYDISELVSGEFVGFFAQRIASNDYLRVRWDKATETAYITENNAGASVDVGTVAFVPADDLVWIRMQVILEDDTTITTQYRIWDEGDFQPPTWTASVNRPAKTNTLGRNGLSIRLTSTSRSVYVDEYTLGDAEFAPPRIVVTDGAAIRADSDNIGVPSTYATNFNDLDIGDPPFGDAQTFDLADYYPNDGLYVGTGFSRTSVEEGNTGSGQLMWGLTDFDEGRGGSGIDFAPPDAGGLELGFEVSRTESGVYDESGPFHGFLPDILLSQVGFLFGCDPLDNSDHISLSVASDITLTYSAANCVDGVGRMGHYLWNMSRGAPNYAHPGYPPLQIYNVFWPIESAYPVKWRLRLVGDEVALWHDDVRVMFPHTIPALYRDRSKYGLCTVQGYGYDDWVLQDGIGLLDNFYIRPYDGDLGDFRDDPSIGTPNTIVEASSANSIQLTWPDDAPTNDDGFIVEGTRIMAVLGKGINSNSNTFNTPPNWHAIGSGVATAVQLARVMSFEYIATGNREVPGENCETFFLDGVAANLIGTTFVIHDMHPSLWSGLGVNSTPAPGSTTLAGPVLTQVNQKHTLAIWVGFTPSNVNITGVPQNVGPELTDFTSQINGGSAMRLCVATATLNLPDGEATSNYVDAALDGTLASTTTSCCIFMNYYIDPREP